MIERPAQVVRVEAGHVWVAAHAEAACGSCSARSGCGAGALNRWLAGRQRLLRIRTDEDLAVGDAVTVGIAESALVQGSLLLYLLPLVVMLVCAVLARELAPPGAVDPAAAAAGLAGLAASLLLVRSAWFGALFRGWQPELRRVDARDAGSATVVFMS